MAKKAAEHEIEWVALDEVEPAPVNPKRHDIDEPAVIAARDTQAAPLRAKP